MKLPAVLALLAAAPAAEAADLARLRRPLAKGGESPAARRRSLRRRSRQGNRPTHRSLSNDELVGSVAAVEFLEAPTTKPPRVEKAHHLFPNNKKHGIKQTEFDIDEIGSVPSVESFLDVETTTAPPPPPVKETSNPGHKAKSKIKQATFKIGEIGSVPSVESFLDAETTTTLPTKASSIPGPKEKSPGLKQSEFFVLSNDLELIDFDLEPAPVEEESCLSMDAAEFAEPERRLVREDRKKRRRRRKRRVA